MRKVERVRCFLFQKVLQNLLLQVHACHESLRTPIALHLIKESKTFFTVFSPNELSEFLHHGDVFWIIVIVEHLVEGLGLLCVRALRFGRRVCRAAIRLLIL